MAGAGLATVQLADPPGAWLSDQAWRSPRSPWPGLAGQEHFSGSAGTRAIALASASRSPRRTVRYNEAPRSLR